MSTLNIFVVVTSLQRGGAELMAAALANAWSASGARVSAATVHDAPDGVGLAPAIPVASLAHAGAAGSPVRRLRSHAADIVALRRLIRGARPDVVVAHSDRTNVLALLATRGLGVPLIVVEHNDPRIHPIGRVWDALRRLTYPWAARIVGVSRGASETLSARLGAKVVTIHNPVLVAEVAEAPRIGGQHVVAMGRLTRQKGFDLLIDAFARVRAARPAATLTIWGRGEERARLAEQAEALGLGSSVRFAGFTSEPHRALIEGSLFVLPSRWEGFGLALAEAMALGLPVVACDCPSGPAEIVRDGIDGLLVPPEDAGALAAAIGRVLDDPDLAARLGARAGEVRERFSLARTLAKWDALLAEVVAGGPGR